MVKTDTGAASEPDTFQAAGTLQAPGPEGSLQRDLVMALAPLQAAWVEVANESHGHAVAPGSETHFRVLVVADVFVGASRLQRHRQVLKLVEAVRKRGIHALALELLTDAEWQKVKDARMPSPKCRGGDGSLRS